MHKLLLTAAYGYILFVHFTKSRDSLHREFISNSVIFIVLVGFILIVCEIVSLSSAARPAFYNYIVIMFTASAVALFGCGLAVMGASFGIWYL